MSIGILIIDPQYDFMPGGALGVEGGDQIVGPINALIAREPEAPLFVSRDWHPLETKHFKSGGGIWPPHCVEGTEGANFHKDLNIDRANIVTKGTDPEDDGGYSAFDGSVDDRSLREVLRTFNVHTLFVAGLATDYCVKHSVLDARKNGFNVFVLKNGIRAVNIEPQDGEKAIREMEEAGAYFIA